MSSYPTELPTTGTAESVLSKSKTTARSPLWCLLLPFEKRIAAPRRGWKGGRGDGVQHHSGPVLNCGARGNERRPPPAIFRAHPPPFPDTVVIGDEPLFSCDVDQVAAVLTAGSSVKTSYVTPITIARAPSQ